jgi:hypothetical protein
MRDAGPTQAHHLGRGARWRRPRVARRRRGRDDVHRQQPLDAPVDRQIHRRRFDDVQERQPFFRTQVHVGDCRCQVDERWARLRQIEPQLGTGSETPEQELLRLARDRNARPRRRVGEQHQAVGQSEGTHRQDELVLDDLDPVDVEPQAQSQRQRQQLETEIAMPPRRGPHVSVLGTGV